MGAMTYLRRYQTPLSVGLVVLLPLILGYTAWMANTTNQGLVRELGEARAATERARSAAIAATGAVDVLKEAHTDNMTPYQAEHEKCVLLANTQERYAPIELIRLG